MSDRHLSSTPRPIMNITATSSYVPPLQGTSGVQPASIGAAADADGGAGDAKHVHKSHGGGGQMRQALAQALQSPGLAMPQSAGGSTPANAASGSTDADGDSDSSTSATGGVKQDMRQFMHALFQAVKGETAAGASSSGSAPTDPKTGFAAGLSALISQVSAGSAPSELQSAFSKLTSDLPPTGAAASTAATAGSTAASGGAASAQATLQALLSSLQQNLGYGSSATSAIGNLVSTQA